MTFFTVDDHEIPADTREVLAASAFLQITEFRLFELAYQRWFGKPARVEEIEPAFTVYMFRDVVPPWVRQFTRAVLQAVRSGSLDPAAFGVAPRRARASRYGAGVRITMTAVLITLALTALSLLIGHYA